MISEMDVHQLRELCKTLETKKMEKLFIAILQADKGAIIEAIESLL